MSKATARPEAKEGREHKWRIKLRASSSQALLIQKRART